jgi:hypothetical protein
MSSLSRLLSFPPPPHPVAVAAVAVDLLLPLYEGFRNRHTYLCENGFKTSNMMKKKKKKPVKAKNSLNNNSLLFPLSEEHYKGHKKAAKPTLLLSSTMASAVLALVGTASLLLTVDLGSKVCLTTKYTPSP